MEHIVVDGSVHTACKQHQRIFTQICMQICLCVLCELGPVSTVLRKSGLKQPSGQDVSNFTTFIQLSPKTDQTPKQNANDKYDSMFVRA